uniref:RCC1-like domain-containing protein n=1 Tax=Cannabis sativa TaxID=3483 RepID=A0A803PZQ3_CANSA
MDIEFALLFSDCGSVFTCGDGSFGQLGHGDYKSYCSPIKLSYFVNNHVEQMACGMRHSLVLLKFQQGHSGDQIYAFGSGKRGQLGISKDKVKSVSLPEVTCGLDGINIVSIAANGDHSAALSNDGKLYTWGRGFQGKSDAYYPEHLTTSFCSTKATLGWNHALLLTGNGEACILGGNRHGVLSRPDKVSALENMQDSNDLLEEVPGLDGEKVVDIAAGSEHSALITEKGVVKTWGWGEHGQLGLGNTVDQTSPQPVTLYNEVPTEAVTSKVYCGSGFTIVIRTKDAPLPPRLLGDVTVDLIASYKIKFMEGRLPKHDANDEEYDLCYRCNNLVISWIFHAMSTEIADDIIGSRKILKYSEECFPCKGQNDSRSSNLVLPLFECKWEARALRDDQESTILGSPWLDFLEAPYDLIRNYTRLLRLV